MGAGNPDGIRSEHAIWCLAQQYHGLPGGVPELDPKTGRRAGDSQSARAAGSCLHLAWGRPTLGVMPDSG